MIIWTDACSGLCAGARCRQPLEVGIVVRIINGGLCPVSVMRFEMTMDEIGMMSVVASADVDVIRRQEGTCEHREYRERCRHWVSNRTEHLGALSPRKT
ncbi:MAG TPA: hypothetical protein VEK56_07650 [Vicinamibacterales bacterium]|nr:hypothetical protein [Vicinamibacterales bacterium]